jgi:predicted NUDIX family NTP pyrophosphohydrolase
MKFSAGLALVRSSSADGLPEVLLVHPGGPFWAKKDAHAWSIPKGEYEPELEDGLEAARREFTEELGLAVPDGPVVELPDIATSGKVIRAWMLDLRRSDPNGMTDFDAALGSVADRSNTFETEWPPRSGRRQSFPEVDAAAWFPLATLTEKLHKGQAPLASYIAACGVT